MIGREKRARRPLPGGVGKAPTLVRFSEPDESSCSPHALPLDYIEERAAVFLNEQGFSPGAFVEDELITPTFSDEARDVRYVQLHCRWLRHAIEDGIAEAAAKHAFVLATLLANSKLMREWSKIAPLAEHGNTMLQGQSNIGKANRRREKEMQPEWQRYQEAADPIRKAHPSWKKRRIARRIFETLEPPPHGKGKLQDDSIIKRIERQI
jgi:hypothetical protein